ncbi:hypothetical protein CR513_50417, partial [Mucuna pruriens]
MFRRDEELTIPSWLIFTQLLLFLLLLLLLLLFFFFAVFPFDLDHNHVAAVTPPPSTSSNVFLFDDIQQIDSTLPNHDSTTAPQQRALQGGQNTIIKGEIETGPSMRTEENENMEVEDSSLYYHPCHYFQLATVAFLKCFGLDSSSDGPSTRKHRKTKES